MPTKENVFWAALAVYLFVLPIANTIALRYLAFIVLIAVTAAVLFESRKLPVLPFARYWMAYFMVALVSVYFAVDPSLSLGELKVEVVYSIIILAVGMTWGARMSGFEPIAMLLAAINLVLTLAAFSVASLDMPFGEIRRIHPLPAAGMDANWLLIALFLNVWLANQFWHSGRRGLALLLFGLVALDVWAMMATHNRQNMVALSAGIAAAGLLLLHKNFSWRRALLIVSVLSLLAGLLAAQMLRHDIADISPPTSASSIAPTLNHVGNFVNTATVSDVRWGLWKFSLEKIAEHPWIGGGIGREVFDKLYPEYLPENTQLWHAHNMILNKGIQMGIPGMVAFIALWAALASELIRHSQTSAPSRHLATAGFAAVVAIFVKNQTDDFFVRNVVMSFWLMAGLLIGFLRTRNRIQ